LTQQEYDAQRQELEQQIQQEEDAIRKAKQELQTTQDENRDALKSLQDLLKSSQNQFQQLQDDLKQQTLQFIDAKGDLENQLQQTNKTKQQLESKLENEENRFEWETDFMKERLEAESKRLEEIQTQLEAEAKKRNEMNEKWRRERTEIEEKQRNAARIMNQRFTQLRAVLTERWQSAKKEGRRMESELTARYKHDVQDMEDAIQSLKEALSVSLKSREQLQRQYDHEILQTTKLQETKREIEDKMIANLRDIEAERNNLRQDQVNLELTLEQQSQAVETLETDFKSIRSAMWRLTKRRVRKTRQKIAKTFLRRKGSSDEDEELPFQ
jgi:chromosome segregation ATPase